MSEEKPFHPASEALRRVSDGLMLKSGGTWFFGGNACLNGETHPAISAVYAGVFAAQRAASLTWGNKVSNPVAKFVLGPQGPLFLNGVVTAGTAAVTGVYGAPELAKACLDFCGANGAQSMIWGGVIKFANTARGQLLRNASLAGCEIAILDGLRHVAENAGFSHTTSADLIVPGVGAALVRAFKPRWMPADLAYADMMALAVATGAEAATHGHPLNAISRALAFVAFSRLAVARVQNDNKIREIQKTSLFEIETHIPRAAKAIAKHFAPATP
ncbi:MAG TPA: hypothetical protein VFR09_04500 [Alphaproteobacteria bacterium]|nr:hypothetical protein [Alphaproteobacteria bacterium]